MEAQQWKKSKTTALIIALFLGGFGGHWFYLNNPGIGIMYLLFSWTLIPSLLALIDIIRWLTMDDSLWHKKYEGDYNLDR